MGVQIEKQSKGTGKYQECGYIIYPVSFNDKNYLISILGGSEAFPNRTSISIRDYAENMSSDQIERLPELYEDTILYIEKYYIRNLNAQTIMELITFVFQSYKKHLDRMSAPEITLQDWDGKVILKENFCLFDS